MHIINRLIIFMSDTYMAEAENQEKESQPPTKKLKQSKLVFAKVAALAPAPETLPVTTATTSTTVPTPQTQNTTENTAVTSTPSTSVELTE